MVRIGQTSAPDPGHTIHRVFRHSDAGAFGSRSRHLHRLGSVDADTRRADRSQLLCGPPPAAQHSTLCQQTGPSVPRRVAGVDQTGLRLRDAGWAPACLLDKLQSVMNAAARLICSARKYDHVTSLLRELHWLRVPERITFRLAVYAYRCQHGLAPSYLADDIRRVADVESRRRLRSASTAQLLVPPTEHSTIGDRAFPVAAAHAWNSLTSHVTSSLSLPVFRSRPKAELFARSFGAV